MKEAIINIDERIAGLEFDQVALEASFAQMGKPVEPNFVGAMRRTLGQYAEIYHEDLAIGQLDKIKVRYNNRSLIRTILLCQKQLADQIEPKLTTIRKAFELLGQGRAVVDIEVAVASNFIIQDL